MEATKAVSVPRSRVASAADMTVTAQLVTRKDKNAKGITCNWTLFFDGVTTEELLELASRAVIIGEQDTMRKHSKPEEMARQEILVRDFLDRERTKAGPPTAERALNLMDKLSTVEKAKVFKKMAEEIGADVPEWVVQALETEG